MERARNRGRPVAAFTLAELVVVLSVVMVLLVLAISAHAKPRNRVYQTTDRNNHRRLMQAMTSFASDNGDLLPYCSWGLSQSNWVTAPGFPLGPAPFAGLATYRQQQLAALTNGQLFPYLGDSRVFMCPADNPDSSLFLNRSVFVSSYTWNAAVNGYGALASQTPNSYKLSQFRPDAILEWEADETVPFFWNDFSSYPDESLSSRHSPELLVGQFGGSVAPIPLASWYTTNLAGPPGARGAGIPVSVLPNRLWCNPGNAYGRF
ncbi:MAG TPA: hypothetical protein VN578_23320 [Candidatus Binatia bacterium]|nr:hypothetical protein [Candidatus Binatia bacterium]